MKKNHTSKEPKSPAAEKDRLENKDKKNTDKKAASQTAIGEHEYEEDRSPDIRMKQQPFNKKASVPDRETDGI